MSSHINLSLRFAPLVLFFVVLLPIDCFAACPVTPVGAQGSAITWTIHVHVTKSSGSDDVTYEFCPSPTPAPPATGYCKEGPEPGPKLRDLNICQNDTVQWLVHTDNGKNGNLVVFQPDGLLGNTLFNIQEGAPPSTASSMVLRPSGKHEYYVAVLDNDRGHVFGDDPKMIVGGSNMQVIAEIIELLNRVKLLTKSLQQPDLSKKLKNDIDQAEKLLKVKPEVPK